MAEDQEQQKPKTTLIKKKPESSDAGADKKKVRVVVKRKPKPKVVAKKRAAEGTPDAGEQTTAASTAPAADSAATTETAAKPTGAVRQGQPAAEAATSESGERGAGAAESRNTTESRSAPSSSPAASGRPTDASARRPEAGGSERPTGRDERTGSAGTGSTGTGRAESRRPDRPADSGRPPARGRSGYEDRSRGDDRGRPSRYGDSGPSRGGAPPARGYDRSGGRGPGPGGPSARSGPGGRPGGPGRPSGPGRPGGPGRPSGPPSGRPGGPPQGRGGGFRGPRPGGGPGGPPSGPGGPNRGGGKKFYKSRKKGPFTREERQREKELNFNRKKAQQKVNPVPKEIDIMEVVTVSELARKMNLKANELIGKLMSMGMMVTINQQIDAETAEILAGEYGCKVNIVSLYEETLIEGEADKDEDLAARSPIVTVMGHVDHGKTKLLDAIRSTDVVAGEHGGITQHIGAYQVTVNEQKITFLDTPGHEAFTLMRARGAQVTDIVVLVVAANDGVMPQTIEAINHAKEADTPIVVAINKVDLVDANIDRVKQQLSEHELIPEDWGGSTPMIEVSALKKEGIDNLLENILLQAELMELKANYDRRAEGKVIESRIDPGRGTVATVLIERGTLRTGDPFVAGIFPGRVRAMYDDHGRKVDEAIPSMPVEIIGFDGVPDAGNPFQVTEDDKSARQVGSKRQELRRVEEAKNVKKVTLDTLYDSIQEGEIQELKVVIKGDVHGSVEALQNALERLSTKEVRLTAIHASAGAINEGDVMLASASNALLIGFHVRPTPRALQLAEREKVDIRKYNIIYDAVEDIRSAMEGMLAPDLQEQTLGAAEVRDTFKVPKIGVIAGCYVTEGKIQRNARVRVYREGVMIHEGAISSLKRFKDDVREVDSGYECGIGVANFQNVKVGDTLEAYVVKEVAKKLEV